MIRFASRHRVGLLLALVAIGFGQAAAAIAAPSIAQSRPLRVGFVHPETGPLGAVASGDGFVLNHLRRALGNGLAMDGGGTRAVEIIVLSATGRGEDDPDDGTAGHIVKDALFFVVYGGLLIAAAR